MTEGMTQREWARRLCEEMAQDDVGDGLDVLTLLDYMGIVGVSFTESSEASEEHMALIAERSARL